MPTNFLDAAGVNGFIATPFPLLSNELNALANNTSALSSVNGSSGVFSSANYAQAIWAQLYLTLGGSITCLAGDLIAGWFIMSPDGGSTFEITVSANDQPRTPDFRIPFTANAYTSGQIILVDGITRIPSWSHKIFVMSHIQGGALPAVNTNIIKAAPFAIQY